MSPSILATFVRNWSPWLLKKSLDLVTLNMIMNVNVGVCCCGVMYLSKYKCLSFE